MSLIELKKREELAEVKRSRRDCRVVYLFGIMLAAMGIVLGTTDYWCGPSVSLMVLSTILIVGGVIGERYYDTKCKECVRHMEEDTEEDKR